MARVAVRSRDKDTLARFLGWFGVGLGTAQLAAPGALCRLAGASGEGACRPLMRALGGRELASGLGILARPRPTAWLWFRVAGDALDLSLLGLVAARNRRARTAFAIANVAAVTVPDVFEAIHLTRERGEPRRAMLVRKAVTIRRPRHEVEEAWKADGGLVQKVERARAAVTFAEAPGNRGTELAVELARAPRGGDLGAAALKLAGRDLPTELADDLRRLKQRLETGEVVRSDSTPTGHLLATHLKQRPAQPLAEAAR